MPYLIAIKYLPRKMIKFIESGETFTIPALVKASVTLKATTPNTLTIIVR